MEERRFAEELFFVSPRAYKFFRKKFSKIPTPTTIRNWRSLKFIPTGANSCLHNDIAKKVSEMKEIEKICIILFDELSIQPKLEYNHSLDQIVGKFVKCFYLGICILWKLILNYTFILRFRHNQ